MKPARIAYCIGLAGMVIPPLFYRQFGPNFFPAWPGLPGPALWSCLFSVIIIAACAAIVLEKNGRMVSFLLGSFLLAVYIFGYIPYELAIEPHNNYLGSWAEGLKEPALAGGAFVIAGSFPVEGNRQGSPLIKLQQQLTFVGPAFFCLTMILYGICHFLYTKYISVLVPAWFPGGPEFWTKFAGIALIGAGLAITIRIKQQLVATLLSIMIFIWLLIIHIPLAIADPFGNHSNSTVSAFSAVAFIGITVAIAGTAEKNAKEGRSERHLPAHQL